MPVAELERLWQRLRPLAVDKMPLSEPPPRTSRFGSPLVLSRVHWARPEMVVEVSYAEWTPDGLLRRVVYLGEREDKPASDVRRPPGALPLTQQPRQSRSLSFRPALSRVGFGRPRPAAASCGGFAGRRLEAPMRAVARRITCCGGLALIAVEAVRLAIECRRLGNCCRSHPRDRRPIWV
jgi:ATP dependent DNA ligase C terminal region